ncbi:MAG: hypothetical protein IJX51_05560 [Clostridia bacterium]|nr:hypothetical protein [Clostridia bacterium]
MKNKLIGRILALALLCCVCICSFGCANAEEEEQGYIWKEKWDGMIAEPTEDISVIMIHKSSYSATLEDHFPAYFTEEEIDKVIGKISEIEFEEISLEEHNPSDIAIDSGALTITVIADTAKNTDSESGELIYDETGTTYKRALRIYISDNGYAYIVDTSNNNQSPLSFGWCEGDKVFKSTSKVDYNGLRQLYNDNAKSLTPEEHEAIFGY